MIGSYIFLEIAIECIEIIVLEPIPVRRIRNDRRRRIARKEWGELLGILARKVDITRYSGSLCISLSNLDHLRIDIWCIYLIFSTWIGFHACDIFHTCEFFAVVEGEWFDTEMPIHSWGDIACEHRGFYRDRPWSTKWIKEWFSIFPVRKSNKGAGKIFFDRCFSCFLSVSSLVKRITRDIEHDMSDIIDDKDEDMYFYRIRIVRSMERREDRFLADRLYRRSITQERSCRWCLYDDQLFSCEIFTPANVCERIVEAIKGRDFLSMDIDIDSIRESTSHKKLIGMCEFSWSRYESILDFHISESYLFRFSSYEGLESWLTRESESYITRIVADFLVLLGCVWYDFHECEYREKCGKVKVCFIENYCSDKISQLLLFLFFRVEILYDYHTTWTYRIPRRYTE